MLISCLCLTSSLDDWDWHCSFFHNSFQHLMDQVLRLHAAYATDYLDDVIIYSNTWACAAGAHSAIPSGWHSHQPSSNYASSILENNTLVSMM